ncbi:ethanolamine-phosphate cytidylyltransferase [Thecamonas trahens ATCC 50062]|uniref:ethanolamine-phosphate cytidylyltransferase n=1 Tax=Thecamonas trahens ATCC 50062 TaxID=461836 RepID=A0A0L0D946_THETB|nr:ethanolamine-phosphate cytidylyltransferase [Thecamonas trahens ATCC 50062]KNC48561.1 ethanolamine-phosphate cytidylyltransferase [Thecamonas trahens ATCC 50062]|eukprot:XP_013762617.1 ethanolamine-phosphate cytidylyltransferase [Thecamonas trahens ATCC 50062]
MLRACKWVDEVVEAAPYVTQVSVLDEHNIDFCLHGDDPTFTADGTDCYAEVKAAGRYREYPRTPGVSTTDLIARMMVALDAMDAGEKDGVPTALAESREEYISSRFTKGSDFIANSYKIAQFARTVAPPKPDDTVVYVDGAFDVAHAGHMSLLAKAKALGTYLIVGIYDDATVNSFKGGNLPICTQHERALSLLSCRHVDDVVFGAPLFLTASYLDALGVDVVVHGTVLDQPSKLEADPYRIAKERDIFRTVESDFQTTTTSILERVRLNRSIYEERNRRKQAKEAAAAAAIDAGESA